MGWANFFFVKDQVRIKIETSKNFLIHQNLLLIYTEPQVIGGVRAIIINCCYIDHLDSYRNSLKPENCHIISNDSKIKF